MPFLIVKVKLYLVLLNTSVSSGQFCPRWGSGSDGAVYPHSFPPTRIRATPARASQSSPCLGAHDHVQGWSIISSDPFQLSFWIKLKICNHELHYILYMVSQQWKSPTLLSQSLPCLLLLLHTCHLHLSLTPSTRPLTSLFSPTIQPTFTKSFSDTLFLIVFLWSENHGDCPWFTYN